MFWGYKILILPKFRFNFAQILPKKFLLEDAVASPALTTLRINTEKVDLLKFHQTASHTDTP